ncbi:MAG: thioredoxin [Saprospiraceae bacterium]|nr:thioredoxin [Saprospiraceae bacterium]
MSFKIDVIQRSKTVPVVVDFWAPWCGPCRVLGPTIEQLAKESNGAWELVKINTEEEQQLAHEYGIRSIPNVKMFYNGKVVAEFAGAQPRHQILQWLDENLPNADKAAWAELKDFLKEITTTEAIDLLTKFIKNNPNHLEARLSLAGYLAFSDPGAAAALLSDVKMGEPGYDLLEDIKNLNELAALSDDNHSGLSAQLMEASQELQKDNLEKAVEQIIEVVKIDKLVHNELPRRAAIAIFHILGNQHPVTRKYRRIFDMALY